ncbi:MAG: hypothetical protein RLZZ118_986 [Bacteroidota bacterium]|jgi:uncharacterized protein YecT (DUF1311 family)
MIQKSIIIILITLSFNCNSQTIKTIENIELAHQNCLDKGGYMKGCSVEYYNQADSLLNVVYKKLKLKLSAEEQLKLKKEQLEWLKKRDKYFQKVYSEEKNFGNWREGSNDFDMVIFDQKAKFVFERVKVLIKKLPYDTKIMTMTFEEYEEGDYPHLIFKDIYSEEEYDFRFLGENNLKGVSILLDDNDAAFGLKANPKYLKKTFIVETKKKAVLDSDLEGKTIKSKGWVITSIKLK